VRPIGLEYRAVGLGPVLIYGAALQGFGCLAVLQIKANTEATAGADIRRALNYHRGLVQAEAVAQYIEGSQQVDSAKRLVEVVAIVAVKGQVECRTAYVVQQGLVVLICESRFGLSGGDGSCGFGISA